MSGDRLEAGARRRLSETRLQQAAGRVGGIWSTLAQRLGLARARATHLGVEHMAWTGRDLGYEHRTLHLECKIRCVTLGGSEVMTWYSSLLAILQPGKVRP